MNTISGMKNGIKWEVKINKDNGYEQTNYSAEFIDEQEAEDYFKLLITDEFDSEITEGLVSDQEIQNIVNNRYYFYENNQREILIELKEQNESPEEDLL